LKPFRRYIRATSFAVTSSLVSPSPGVIGSVSIEQTCGKLGRFHINNARAKNPPLLQSPEVDNHPAFGTRLSDAAAPSNREHPKPTPMVLHVHRRRQYVEIIFANRHASYPDIRNKLFGELRLNGLGPLAELPKSSRNFSLSCTSLDMYSCFESSKRRPAQKYAGLYGGRPATRCRSRTSCDPGERKTDSCESSPQGPSAACLRPP
jgi:hypothetical protein